ncbi:hypothetical protein EW093_04380 [Thiospirochaeta perfilievii]|uniref:M23 family metallopeptidase n=1 Tax=Thiospirochaeta perfilievii TaxID=252967 RepID=A0A5C1Q944_9SPIO|nr:M23/M56 family metallopeptidase [Thiospirochaeta perfilievii]QEN03967.1 hypothetical protein EW093_04380 [Thiospirochaeta perfilievii]
MIKIYIISQILLLPLFLSYCSLRKRYNNHNYQWVIHRLILILTLIIPSLILLKPVGSIVDENTLASVLVNKRLEIDSNIPQIYQDKKIESDNSISKLEKKSKNYFVFKEIILLITVISLFFTIIREVFNVHKLKKGTQNRKYIDGIKIVFSSRVKHPFSHGIIKPVIFMPIGLIKTDEDIIIEHELNHIRNCHLIWLNFEVLLKKIFWFNPYYYFLNYYGEILRELLCDEISVKNINYLDYTTTLLNNISSNKTGKNSVICAGICKESTIKKRVKNLLLGVKMDPKGLNRYKSVIITSLILLTVGIYPVKVYSGEVVLNKTLFEDFLDESKDGGALLTSYTKAYQFTDIIRSISDFRDDYPLGSPLKSFRITLPWGLVMDPFGSEFIFHPAVDMAFKKGEPIYSTGAGEVVVIDYDPEEYGNYIVVKHRDNLFSTYAHLDKVLVTVGSKITKGFHIGDVGSTGRSTGPHLSYEINYYPNGYPKKLLKGYRIKTSINPYLFLPRESLGEHDMDVIKSSLDFSISVEGGNLIFSNNN